MKNGPPDSPHVTVLECSGACRVARGSYLPPAPTEPDLWASHPALRDIGVGALKRLFRRRHDCPQLFQRQRQLGGSDDAVHLTIPVLEREEPLVRKVPLVESVIHRAAVTERPQGLATLVDDAPCGAGPRSHPDETTDDEAPTLPLPQQQSAQAPPDMRIEIVQGAHHGISAAGPEEIQPSAKIRVERGEAATKRLSPCSRRQLADSRIDAAFRPRRQKDFDRAVLRSAPETEADEVPFFGSGYRTLGLIHREAQPPVAFVNEIWPPCDIEIWPPSAVNGRSFLISPRTR
jgi:hypothetical protein